MEKQRYTLDELEVYQLAMTIGKRCWDAAITWDDFARKTLGNQMIRAADSVAANISEGYGRFSYKENKLFYYYARGSLYETRTWFAKALERRLITDNDYQELQEILQQCGKKLNRYIQSIGTKVTSIADK